MKFHRHDENHKSFASITKIFQIDKYKIWDLSGSAETTDEVSFHRYVLRKPETKAIRGLKLLVTRRTRWHAGKFLPCHFAVRLSIVITLWLNWSLLDVRWGCEVRLWGEAVRWGVDRASSRAGLGLLLFFLRPDQDRESSAWGRMGGGKHREMRLWAQR